MKLTYGPDRAGGSRDLFLDGELCASAVLSSDAIQIVEAIEKMRLALETLRLNFGQGDDQVSAAIRYICDQALGSPELVPLKSEAGTGETCLIRCLDESNSCGFLQVGKLYEARVSEKYFELVEVDSEVDGGFIRGDDSDSEIVRSPWIHSQWLQERFEIVSLA